jgi:DNA-binding LacI/PurR family transcriptional regulator
MRPPDRHGGARRASRRRRVEARRVIAGPETAPVSNDRLLGVRTALAARGLALECVLHADYSYDGGRAIVAAHLAGASRPDTVICANDAMALGVMDAYRFDFGLSDSGRCGRRRFDDVPQAAWPSYALTTLRQPVRRMAQMTVRVLMEQISGTPEVASDACCRPS